MNGDPVPAHTKVWDLAALLRSAKGPQVRLELAAPDGTTIQRRVARSEAYHREAEKRYPLSRDLRVGVRLAVSLLTCLALIACAALLYLRRPRDPVALLFSFSFLLFAATIDPPMVLWLALGWDDLFDVPLALA